MLGFLDRLLRQGWKLSFEGQNFHLSRGQSEYAFSAVSTQLSPEPKGLEEFLEFLLDEAAEQF